MWAPVTASREHSTNDKLDSWSFSGPFGRHFEALVKLQMWCFGYDIRRPEGNLLLRFGFERSKLPTGQYGSSYYSKVLDSTHTMHLWGFAMALERPGIGLLVKRNERTPRVYEGARIEYPLWRPQDLPHGYTPREEASLFIAKELLSRLTAALSDYEQFVADTTPRSFQALRSAGGPRRNGKLPKGTLTGWWREFPQIPPQTLPQIPLHSSGPISDAH